MARVPHVHLPWRRPQPAPPSTSATFRRPIASRTLYKEFLYLNEEDALAALSALRGGVIVEQVRAVAYDASRGVSIGAKLSALELGFEGKRNRHLEEEVRMRQDIHSAVGQLLDILREQEPANGDGAGGADNLSVGDVVELNGEAAIPASERVFAAMGDPPWWFTRLKWLLRSPARRYEERRAFEQAKVGERFVAVVGERVGSEKVARRAVLDCDRRWLRSRPNELAQFSGPVTVVGKVVGVAVAGKGVLLEDSDTGVTYRMMDDRDDSDSLGTSRPRRIVLDEQGRLLLSPLSTTHVSGNGGTPSGSESEASA